MSWNRNELTEKLRIEYPIFQAPMAGGITTAALISEVSNNGGMGNLGAGYMAPEEIKEEIRQIRSLTDKPFGVNLFVPDREVSYKKEEIDRMGDLLTKYSEELGMKERPGLPEKDYALIYEKHLEVILQEPVPVCSFTFGMPDRDTIRELKKQEIAIIGTATNVKEAVELDESGVDMIVAQGSEAGGHRGTFHQEESGLIGSMALIPQVVDAVSKPVIAAGGIMDARGIAAAMMLGAAGIQLGTVFLTCRESGANPFYKKAILTGTEDQTALTKAFSGKLARGISNRFLEEMNGLSVLPYPLQNDMTAPIRKQAARFGKAEFMSLWAGQGVRMAKETTAKELMEKLVGDTEALWNG